MIRAFEFGYAVEATSADGLLADRAEPALDDFSQNALVGMNWMWKRGCSASD